MEPTLGTVRIADALASADPFAWLTALACLGADVQVHELVARFRPVFGDELLEDLIVRCAPRNDRVDAAEFCKRILQESARSSARLLTPDTSVGGGTLT